MPKISTYPIAESITLNDYLLGTQVDNNDDTKNFLLSDIQTLFGGGSGGGGAISVTKTALDALVASNGLVPGTYYIISGVDVALYGGTTILIQAATTNTLELVGHGVFYNPKYINNQNTPGNGYGIWYNYITCTFSNVVGVFQENDFLIANNGAEGTYLTDGFIRYISGDWDNAESIIGDNSGATADISNIIVPIYNESDTVIWGGKKWVSNTGTIGTAIDRYTLDSDWTSVSFNSTDYNVVADVIHYDYSHDIIIRRKDKWSNDVDVSYPLYSDFIDNNRNPIKDFQWGNGPEDYTVDYNEIGVYSNYINDSYFECINFVGRQLINSYLIQNSEFTSNITDKNSSIRNLNLNEYGTINNNVIVSSTIDNMILSNNSEFYNNRMNQTNFQYITLNRSRIYNNKTYGTQIASITLNTYSSIYDNNFIQGTIETTTLNNYALIYNNTSTDNFYLQKNTLNNSSIYSNTLGPSGNIFENTLLNLSQINDNAILNGAMLSNNMLNFGKIQYNDFNGTCDISYNVINDSSIQDNVVSNGYISNNVLSNYSFIQNNELSLSGSQPFLYNNKLDNSYIANNQLIGGQITQNTLSLGTISDNILNLGFIDENTINTGGGIQANTISSNGNISNNLITTTSTISDNTITTSFIYANTVNNYSQINENTLLASQCYIQFNSVNTSSKISGNELSILSYIQNNSLDSSQMITMVLTSASIIENNNIRNFSFLRFTSTLSNVIISQLDISGGVDTQVSLAGATIIYLSITKQIFKNFSGSMKLGYYNASNVFTVVDINA